MTGLTSGISSPGIGSGLDVKGIVDKLVAIEHRPIDALQKQSVGIQSKLSNFSLLKSYMSNVQNAAAKLADLTLWRSTTATSSNPAAVVAATGTGTAVPGSYRVEVANLAQPQTTASPPVGPLQSGVGAGHLHIDFGSWNADASSFAPAEGSKAIDITIEQNFSSLESVRDQINAAQGGVTASILNDASGSRLVLTGNASGANNGFRISASGPEAGDAPPPGLAALAYDPPNGASQSQRSQAATNANLTINGVAVSSASNVVDAAIPGLVLNLKQVTQGPVDVAVAADTEGMRSALKNLVNAYNDMTNYIASQTRFDAATRTASALTGDGSTLALQKQLRSAFSASSSASADFGSLLQLGVHLQAGNTLAIDNTRLDQALANPQELARAFGQNTGDDSSNGIGVRIKALATRALGVDGLITRGTNALSASVKRNADQRAKMETRVDQVRARLLDQYTRLDTQMGKLTSQSNYVNRQIQAMFKQS